MRRSLEFRGVTFDLLEPPTTMREAESFAILRAWVEDTYASCSFHRKRLDKAGITPDAIASFDDVRRIPPLGAAELDAVSELALLPDRYAPAIASGALSALPPDDRIARKMMSSGSTGKPRVIFDTVRGWEVGLAGAMRVFAHIPPAQYARVFSCFNPGHTAAKVYEDALGRSGCVVESRHFSKFTNEDVIRQLYAGDFNCLAMPPCSPPGVTAKGSTLDALLDEDVENYIGRKIGVVLSGGVGRPPELRIRERVHEANELAGRPPALFVDFYGSTEVFVFAATCEHDDGVHLLPGLTYGEVIDERTGRHVGNGERGLVVASCLRDGSRYLRYVVGDEATYVTDPCRCGRTTPRLRDIVRVHDRERLRGGCAAGW